MIDWLIDWFIHLFIHSFIYSLTHPFIHSFIYLFIYFFIIFINSFRVILLVDEDPKRRNIRIFSCKSRSTDAPNVRLKTPHESVCPDWDLNLCGEGLTGNNSRTYLSAKSAKLQDVLSITIKVYELWQMYQPFFCPLPLKYLGQFI